LSGYQLLVPATVMSITLVVSDISFGVWSDAFSRKWPLVGDECRYGYQFPIAFAQARTLPDVTKGCRR
jgi:hypothetical protein